MPKTPTKSYYRSSEAASPYRTPTRRSIGDFDKFECSPNSRSKCQKCNRKIQSGTKRVGKKGYDPRFGERFLYYHDQCFPNKHTLSLPGGRTPDDELAKQNKEEKQNSCLLIERAKLREMLRQFRRGYAQRLGYSDRAFLVFQDTTLDDLTIKMPRNRTEMMRVNGMGPKRLQNIGEALLQVIKKYLQEEERSKRNTNPSQPVSNAARQTTSPKSATDDSKESNDDVTVEQTLTQDDILNQLLAAAEARGEVITLDDD